VFDYIPFPIFTHTTGMTLQSVLVYLDVQVKLFILYSKQMPWGWIILKRPMFLSYPLNSPHFMKLDMF